MAAESEETNLELPPPKALEWMAQYADMQDLPPEDATEEELNKINEVREQAMYTLGQMGVLEGMLATGSWWRHFFLRGTLMRFLRSKKGDATAAKDHLLGAIGAYHEQNYWKDVIGKFEEEDSKEKRRVIQKYDATGLFGVDKRGCPVFYHRMGVVDTGGILREIGWDLELYKRSRIHRLEIYADITYKAALKKGIAFAGRLSVIDLTGVSYINSRVTIGMSTMLMRDLHEQMFPGQVGPIIIVNAPWFFNWGWAIVKQFLPERVVEKTQIYGSNFLSVLETYIDKSEIPAFLGGDSPEPWPYGEGGLVPDEAGTGAPLATQLHVKTKETLVLEVPRGKVFVWEFRVLHHDIGYKAQVGEEELTAQRRVSAKESWLSQRYISKNQDTPVKITLTFDNSYSWRNEKDIEYRTQTDDDILGVLSAEGGSSEGQYAPLPEEAQSAPPLPEEGQT